MFCSPFLFSVKMDGEISPIILKHIAQPIITLSLEYLVSRQNQVESIVSEY